MYCLKVEILSIFAVFEKKITDISNPCHLTTSPITPAKMHNVFEKKYEIPLKGLYLLHAFLVFRASIPTGITKVFEKK